MALLNSKIQTFIVQQFVMYSTPQEIVDLVKVEFGVETTRQQVFFLQCGDESAARPEVEGFV